ncbi:hypothetical protein ACJMK2_044445 [Sinanodonta woodiana]|uniref:Ig-like domain-containing protein n=1 Tax=Sinanodonta woodiana TaxID=1069815 RepID=A0ABD3W031_SINWO
MHTTDVQSTLIMDCIRVDAATGACAMWLFRLLYIHCWIASGFGFNIGHPSGMESRYSTPTPEFIDTPLQATYHTGDLAILHCSIHNLGTKTVIWRRANVQAPITIGPLTYIADDRFQVNHIPYKDQWNLLIKNVQLEDEGTYECQVSSTDRTIRRLITLTVEEWKSSSPRVQMSGPEFVEKGEKVILTCNATGINYPPEEMDWFRNGQKLLSDVESGIEIYKRVSISSKSITSILEIKRATMEDDGTYICRSSDLHISSKKLNVLNAGTSNVKRGTGSDKSSRLMSGSSNSNPALKWTIFLLLILTVSAVFV